jgi:polyketide cyclase/dehydrase/lipid transport protein
MAHGEVAQVVSAAPEAVFDLLHDYDRRLEWDTLLSAAYLTDGFVRAEQGATSVCVGRRWLGGIALKTVYVVFERPRVAAVKMLNAPPFFGAWAASIRHEPLGPSRSRVVYVWTFTARPGWLRWLLEPTMNRLFEWETRKRLRALARRFAASAGPGAV